MRQRFSDAGGGFFDTPSDGESLLIRPKDLQDNATPSGNALACEALLTLAAFADDPPYHDATEQAIRLIADSTLRHPLGFARWLSNADSILENGKQIAVVWDAKGKEERDLIRFIRSRNEPNAVVAAAAFPPPLNAPALLMNRPLQNDTTTVYFCRHFVCKQPVNSIEELKKNDVS
ncbi:MAG TPA: hypothetical protein VLX61_09365 [Anaerolineales bacterium]|nr:hypothetical protein [Anaerolineales bacterium]